VFRIDSKNKNSSPHPIFFIETNAISGQSVRL